MSSQTTKAALKLLEKTEFLVSSIKTEKSTVSARAGQISHEVFSDAGKEAPAAPDWDTLQEWNVELLEASGAEVRRTDRTHRLNRVRDGQLRQNRREQVGGLQDGHRDLQKSFTGTYGEESLPLVGLDAPPARAFLAVREQMKEVVERMRDDDMASRLPEPKSGQSAIELKPLANAKEEEIDLLEETMEAIRKMRKRLDRSLVARDEAQARHRRVYVNVARVQEGLFRLAGLDELADRIRVTVPTPRKKAEEAEAADGEQEETQEERNEESTETQAA